jgi:hypothetical protein
VKKPPPEHETVVAAWAGIALKESKNTDVIATEKTFFNEISFNLFT